MWMLLALVVYIVLQCSIFLMPSCSYPCIQGFAIFRPVSLMFLIIQKLAPVIQVLTPRSSRSAEIPHVLTSTHTYSGTSSEADNIKLPVHFLVYLPNNLAVSWCQQTCRTQLLAEQKWLQQFVSWDWNMFYGLKSFYVLFAFTLVHLQNITIIHPPHFHNLWK